MLHLARSAGLANPPAASCRIHIAFSSPVLVRAQPYTKARSTASRALSGNQETTSNQQAGGSGTESTITTGLGQFTWTFPADKVQQAAAGSPTASTSEPAAAAATYGDHTNSGSGSPPALQGPATTKRRPCLRSQVKELPVESIIRPLGRTRGNNQEKVEALMASIQEIGLQEPIDVLEVDGKIYGFSGCHRYEAHQRLGLPTILCRVRKANQEVLRMHMA